MISQPKNRVQAIKSKFENLQSETEPFVRKPVVQLNKQHLQETFITDSSNKENNKTELQTDALVTKTCLLQEDWTPEPNTSYLYSKHDIKSICDTKKSLSRQTSDPGKKLHRSHAFRCDRSQIQGPKRHGSCNGRSESSDFSLKRGERKLSKDRLKQLGDFIENKMSKDNLLATPVVVGEVLEAKQDSVPDSDVPQHILDQYAKVNKTKKTDKQDSMTDSGVSSETENTEEEKNKIKNLISQYEKPEIEVKYSNLPFMDDLCGSSETMKLEKKNPHLVLTDTLKKALKQPLPPGPPPKKPPRTFAPAIPEVIEKPKKDTKKMLEKLEQVLQKREAQNQPDKNIYDIAETNLSTDKKEVHYLCTEILDITQRTLSNQPKDQFSKCLNSLNCAIMTTNSTLSLPYTRLSENPKCCSNENLLSTFQSNPNLEMSVKCVKCRSNDEESGFKCHLDCVCKSLNSVFYVKEHIYDVPIVESKSDYGVLNLKGSTSRSMENIKNEIVEEKIYDEPCEESRPASPEEKSEFQRLRANFELVPEKPAVSKKPLVKVWKSTENVSLEFESAKQSVAKKFATERKRSKKMDRLTRSLTEKRKNYVRRVSSRVAYLEPKNSRSLRYRHQTSICSYRSEVVDNPYCTFRSWKSFRTSQSNLAKKMDDAVDANLSVDSEDVGDNVSVHEKAGCVDIELPFVPRERGLFNVCLLVGLNYMSGQAYVKSVFPSQVQVPPHIENLIFPETLSPGSLGEWTAEKTAHYCRRVLPEGATTCLPLCYCLIGKYRSPGFYYKLFETDFPNSGEQITITYNRTEKREKIRNSPNSEVSRSRTMPRSDCSINIRVRRELETDSEVEREKSEEREIQVKRESLEKHVLPDFYDLENNNAPKRVMISLGNTNYKTLKTSLQMETNKQKDGQDTKTRNVMISEAFLRFFVDILGDFWRFFEEREMKDGDLGRNGVVFDNQYFLEWFTETAMFTHFIQNMAVAKNESDLVDTPLPSYYELFKQRVQSRTKMNSKSGDKNYKSAVNKKVRMLKNKLRDLVA
ncbi:unnamed protein product [Leptidea sinapis]|uniref:Uncharacterized protein n=1 Tax=Leptidea sinapis TaxID=189913 RepID=A0A5E4Q611_9NEOP|nr:unnamed protein product [Leptidea sinapis]